MAAVGFTPISLYYSATAAAVPLAANLVAGELALNTADGKLYYKSLAGVVTLLAGATAGPAGGSNTQVQFNSSGALAGSANLTWSGTALAITGTLTATSTLASATAIVNTTNANGTFLQIQLSGTPKTYLGSSVAISGVGTSSDTDTFATGKLRLFGDNQVTNYATVSSTGLAVTGTLTLSSATSGTIASFKSTGAYGTVAADNTGTTGGGSFSVKQNGTQYGAFSVDGAIQGNTSSDVAVFADTGSSLKFYTNGSGTVKASISTAGLFTVAGAASIQGLTVGLGNASASATSTAVGISALASSTGADATAFGYFAGENLSSGAFSIAIGSRAMGGTTGGPNTGSYNTAIGNSSLSQNTSGNRNIAIGNEAMTANQGGSYNVAIGSYQAAGGDAVMGVNTAGNGNTAVGAGTLPRSTVSFNTAVGYSAGFYTSSGGPNTHIGAYAGYYCTTGTNNVSLGYGANGFNIASGFMTGSFNTALGDAALYAISSGSYNTSVGYLSLSLATSVSNNTAFGARAGRDTISANNTIIGQDAGLTLSTGAGNTIVGYGAGPNVTAGTGAQNTYLGYLSGNGMTSGAKNTIIGAFTGNGSGLDIRASSNNIVLSDGDGIPGFYRIYADSNWSLSGTDSTNTSGLLFKNNAQTKYWSIATNSSTWYLFDADNSNYVYVSQNFTAWTFVSDQRLKKDIEDIDYGLSAVMAMRPRRYTYKVSGKNDIGFIAQELRDVIPEAVSGQEGEYLETDTNTERAEKSLGVSRDTLIPVLVKAIQELKAEVDSLKSQLNGA